MTAQTDYVFQALQKVPPSWPEIAQSKSGLETTQSTLSNASVACLVSLRKGWDHWYPWLSDPYWPAYLLTYLLTSFAAEELGRKTPLAGREDRPFERREA